MATVRHSIVTGAASDPRALVDGPAWDADHVIEGLTIGTDVQAHDAKLDALAALSATGGLIAQTAASSFAKRTLTGTSNQISVTNGDGVSGNPTVAIASGFFSSAQNWTALHTFNNSVSITGNSDILFAVESNVINALSSLHVKDTSTSASNAQFLSATELISVTGSTHIGVDNDGDRVALYASNTGRSGSGNIWALNTVTQADASFPSTGTIQGYELDFNNHNADRGAAAGFAGLGSGHATAMTITGAGLHKSTAALMVATAVARDLWYRGFLAANGIVDEAFADYSNAAVSYSDRGTHTYGIDLKNAGYVGNNAIRLGNSHKITARNVGDTADVNLIQLDSTDTLRIGLDANLVDILFDRPPAPSADNTYALGTSSARWSNFYSVLATHSTSVTCPTLIGGTAANSTLSFQSTSGVGTTDYIHFHVGNNGGTEAMRIGTTGNISMGSTDTSTYPLYVERTIAGTGAVALKNLSNNAAATMGFRIINDASVYFDLKIKSSTAATLPSTAIIDTAASTPLAVFTAGVQRFYLDANGNGVFGTAAIATTATNGFPYIPTCAGAPTGVPTTYTGRAPMVYDTTNNKIWFYNGAWRGVVVA